MRPAALAAALVLLAAPAPAQVSARIADLRLATAVRLALVDDARTRPLDVAVAARDGGVEVSGDVPAAQQRAVTDVARSVRGVRVVGGSAAAAQAGGWGTDRTAPPLRVQPSPGPRPAPEPAPRPATGGPVYHTVESGDTLFSLARRYGTTVETILDLNGSDSTTIQVGQRLRVR